MEAQLCGGVFETRATVFGRIIPFDEVVGSRRGVVAALHAEQEVPTSHARDFVRHGLGRPAFGAVDTTFSARPWLVLQAAQSHHDRLVWHSIVEQAERKDNLILKICWFQEAFNIPPSRTVNIDETSLRLLPLRRVGWLRGGEHARAITGNEKEFTFLAQVMHKGKTSPVLPPRPC